MKWDYDFKHVDITVDGPQAYRVRQISDMVGVLGSRLQDPCEWKIKIDHVGEYGIYIGICLESVAKWHDFERGDWSSLGHGHYILGSKGHILSHSQWENNFEPYGFNFFTGDIIRVKW